MPLPEARQLKIFTGDKIVSRWEPLVYPHTQSIWEILFKRNSVFTRLGHIFTFWNCSKAVCKIVFGLGISKKKCSYSIVTLNKGSFVTSPHRAPDLGPRWGGSGRGPDARGGRCWRQSSPTVGFLFQTPARRGGRVIRPGCPQVAFHPVLYSLHTTSLKRAPLLVNNRKLNPNWLSHKGNWAAQVTVLQNGSSQEKCSRLRGQFGCCYPDALSLLSSVSRLVSRLAPSWGHNGYRSSVLTSRHHVA